LNRAAFDNMLLKFEPIYRTHTFEARRGAGSGSVSVEALNVAHGGGTSARCVRRCVSSDGAVLPAY
jgi:hypothetical protein